MDTWLKSFKYSKLSKGIACLLLSLALLWIGQGFIIFVSASSESSYYETWSFQNRFIEKAGYVRDWIVRYTDDEIFEPSSISQEQVDSRIQNSKELRDYINKYLSKQEETYTTENHQEVTTVIYEEQPIIDFSYEQGKITYTNQKGNREVITLNEQDKQELEEGAREGILNDRTQYMKQIKNQLKSPNVEYLAFKKGTDKVITNLAEYNGNNLEELIEELQSREVYIQGNGASIEEIGQSSYHMGSGWYSQYYQGENFTDQYDYEVYVAMAKELVAGDQFYTEKTEFDQLQQAKGIAYPLMILGMLIGLGVLIYGLQVIGKKSKDEEIHMTSFDKIPFEIQWSIAGGCAFLLLILFMNGIRGSIIPYYWIPYSSWGEEALLQSIVLYGLAIIGMIIGLLPFTSLVRHIKNRTMSQYIWSIRGTKWMIRKIVASIKEDNLILWVIGGIILYVAWNGIIVFLIAMSWGLMTLILLMLMIAFNVIVVIGILKLTIDYVRIAKAAGDIANGQLDRTVELKYTLPIMKRMADNLSNIGKGLEEAVERTVKSERLKTELITNVSHDLKTPLTSIISYIDLLKDEKIENDTAKEYIDILEERSGRLKQLIEDLVEASKAATGNVKSELQSLELSQLMVQSVGEYSDRLEKSNLEIVMKPLEEVYILADGRHMWRVIENLLSNVSKYAMPHTRVYVEVRNEGKFGKLVIKNISKESLHLLDANELTERFVRGEESRTTEGSGLGLAIAESLIQLQGGQFRIELDGDLFKIEVTMPVA